MKLSKREVFLLTLLLVVALIFVEFMFIINPGKDRMKELNDRNSALLNQIDTINLDLTLAKTLESRRDDNLKQIGTLSGPFIAGVAPDALLAFTHALLVKHGFSPFTYSPSPLGVDQLSPEQAEVSVLTYRIKEIALEYRNLANNSQETLPSETNPTSTTSTDASQQDFIERYTLQIDAAGTYKQVMDLLTELQSLGRSIVVSNVKMAPVKEDTGTPTPTPTPGEAVTPTPAPSVTPAPTDAFLSVELWISFYGIEKLQPTDDPLNKWTRETFAVSTEDPFITVTEATTTETVPIP